MYLIPKQGLSRPSRCYRRAYSRDFCSRSHSHHDADPLPRPGIYQVLTLILVRRDVRKLTFGLSRPSPTTIKVCAVDTLRSPKFSRLLVRQPWIAPGIDAALRQPGSINNRPRGNGTELLCKSQSTGPRGITSNGRFCKTQTYTRPTLPLALRPHVPSNPGQNFGSLAAVLVDLV